MTLHILHVLHMIYNDFTLTLLKILHEDYILSCNYQVITTDYMKKSVPLIFVNGGVPTFLCNYYAFTILLHTNSKILHPGCNVSCKISGISK